LTFLVIIAVSLTRMRNLFSTVIMTGIFSLTSACLFVTMGAVDVAFTEAAVGAGIATLLFLSTLALTSSEALPPTRLSLLSIILVIVTGVILIYGTIDIPKFGVETAPVHHHIAQRFIEDSPIEIGIPNMVTSVLASYRGYDTLGETTVIFTAGIGVLMLLGRGKTNNQKSRKKNNRPD
jgi:multicomponent Na+:H+ antiporter subunit B